MTSRGFKGNAMFEQPHRPTLDYGRMGDPTYKFFFNSPHITETPSKKTFTNPNRLQQAKINFIQKRIETKKTYRAFNQGKNQSLETNEVGRFPEKQGGALIKKNAKEEENEITREKQRLLRRNAENKEEGQKAKQILDKDTLPLTENRGEYLRIIQVLQDVRSAVTSSKARISEVKMEELNRAMNNLEQQGAKFNEQQLERIQSLLNSILSADKVKRQTIQANKQPFRTLIIMLILAVKLRQTFHQQGRTQKIQTEFDKLSDMTHRLD